MTTIAPTFLLVGISNVTNFFNDFKIEISVNLTAMLVITTMFVSVINKLPLTSYIKLIEVWLMFALLVPFCEVIILTYWNKLKSDKGKLDIPNKMITSAHSNEHKSILKDMERKLLIIKRIALFYMPIMEVSFVITFWFFGLLKYIKEE